MHLYLAMEETMMVREFEAEDVAVALAVALAADVTVVLKITREMTR